MSVSNNLNVRLVHAAKTITSWANINVVPILGEVCLVADSTSAPMKYKIKIGDGNRYVAKMVGGAVVDEEDTSDGGILPYFGDFDNLDVNTFQLVAITPGKKNPSDTENNKTTVTFKGIKEVDGKIQVDNTSVLNLEIDGVYDSSNPTKWLVTKETAVSMISDAINSLDGSATASSSSVLTGVVEANGIISKSSEVSYTTIAPVQDVTTSDTGDSGLDVTTSTNTKDVHHKDVNSQRQSTAPTSEGVVPVIMGRVDNYGHVSGEVVSSDKIIAADIKAPVTQQDNSTWNHRVTGGDISIGEDIAKIPVLKGNTMVWNQMVENGNFVTSTNWSGRQSTISVSNGICTVTPSSDGTERGLISTVAISLISTHKYFLKVDVNSPISSTCNLSFTGTYVATGQTSCAANTWTKIYGIATVPSNVNMTFYALINGSLTTTQSVLYKNAYAIDLTKLFGSDDLICAALSVPNLTDSTNLTKAAENFEKLFPNSYYPYCEGRLVNLGGYGVKWNQLVGEETSSVTLTSTHKFYKKISGTASVVTGDGSSQATTGGTDMVCDLTEMFGPGSEPTLEEFEAMFPEDYYEYNAGTEMNIFDVATGENKLGLESTGFNQWDEEWESGRWDFTTDGQKIGYSSGIRCKDYIRILGNTNYYFKSNGKPYWILWYDAAKNFIGTIGGGNTASMIYNSPTNAAYMTFCIGAASSPYTTYNHDICINISDPNRNGTYEPYKKDTLDLDWVRNLEYTPDGSSTPEKLFPYGLLSAGSVHDDVTETKTIKRVGVVDMSSLTYLSSSQVTNGFVATVPGIKKLIETQPSVLVPNVKTVRYSGTYYNAGLNNKEICYRQASGSNTGIFIKDDDFAGYTTSQVANALSGVMLYYELETPIEIDIYPAKNMSYLVDDLGTETQLPANPSNAAPITAPFVGTFEYKSNFKDAIRDLFDKVNNAVNPVKGKDNTSQTVCKLAIYDSSETVKSSLYAADKNATVFNIDGKDVTLPTVQQVIDYVTTQISSALTYKGVINAKASIPTSGRQSGDLWVLGADISIEAAEAATYGFEEAIELEIGDFIIWNGESWDVVHSESHVSNNNPTLTMNGSTYTVGTVEGTALQVTTPSLNFSDPTASGNALSFIDYVKQENGLLNATKKTVQSATSTRLGVVQAAFDSSSDSPSIVQQSSTSNRNYGLQTTANGLAFTNVPWTDSTYKLTVNDFVNGDSNGTPLGTIYTPAEAGVQFNMLTANSSGHPQWTELTLSNTGLLKFDGTGWTLDTNSYITSAVTVLDSIMQNGTAITDSNPSAGLKVIKDGTTSYKKISFAAITNDTSTGDDAVTIILNGNFS